MAEIKTICKRTVVSTKPVQPGKFRRLSALDRVMERNHVRLVYYYRTPAGREAGEATKRLRESISETLCHFPIMTGRLLKDDEGRWMNKCNDAGVRMVEARVKGSVEEWLESVDREKELKLAHWEEMFHKPYFWSTFYVQITEFEEGGLAIGLSCTYLLADPICATVFIKAWADTTLGGKMLTPPFFHPLPPRRPGNTTTNHKPPRHDLIQHYKSSMEKPAPITTVHQHYSTVTFSFSDDMVLSCMAKERGLTLTPFEALAGLFWVCVSRVKNRRSNGTLINMSLCLDTRSVLGLDQGFFGNCMVYNKVGGEGLEENNNNNNNIGLYSKAALVISEVVKKIDIEETMDLVEWLEGAANYDQYPPWMNGYDLVCVNLEGVDSKSAVFEGGFDPIRVSCYIEPALGEGQVFVLPGNEGTLSRVVRVSLPEEEAVKLCGDGLLLHFNPTILTGKSRTTPV